MIDDGDILVNLWKSSKQKEYAFVLQATDDINDVTLMYVVVDGVINIYINWHGTLMQYVPIRNALCFLCSIFYKS